VLSIILPTYNERENIAPLVEAIHQCVSEPLEVVVVDDDSPDRTWEVTAALEKRFPSVRLIRRMGKKGLTDSLREGISHARGEKLLWMDADFSMPPEAIPFLSAALETHPVAIGSRYIQGGKDARRDFLPVFLSAVFNRLAYLLLGGLTDYTTGFVAARREVLEKIPFSGNYGEYCIRFLCEARRIGCLIKEIPYECRPRKKGDSKTFTSPVETLRHGKDYLWTLLSLWLKR